MNNIENRYTENEFVEEFEEQDKKYKWKPFPDLYISKKAQVDQNIPQISTRYPYAHIIAKLTDNFEMFQEFGADDNTTPLKVLCWNDISSLTARMAAKTVEAALDREYASISEKITFECHSVASSKSRQTEFPNNNPDIYVFHVLDPTIPQTRKIRSSHATMISSFSASQLSSIANGKILPPNLENPIPTNASLLRDLSKKYSGQKTIFIFDCSFAKKSLEGILYNEEAKKNPFIIFAATSHLLNYSSQLPCDLFTSCLLTPAKVALLWQSQKVGHFQSGILKEIELQNLIDQLNDSDQSPHIIIMLNSALSAIADKIAIDLLLTSENKNLFFTLFRRDAFTSQLFYNYMFATRVMNSLAMDPSCFPAIADSTQHPLWDTFDLQVDRALFSLVNSFAPIHIPNSLFSLGDLLTEAMDKLHSWLRFPIPGRQMPNDICYLPMLLLSEQHFKPAVIFCSNFIQISEKTARIFLFTRAFPVLPTCLDRIKKNIEMFDAPTIAAFSFVVADSVLLVPRLADYFRKEISFWFQFVPDIDKDTDQLLSTTLNYAKLKNYPTKSRSATKENPNANNIRMSELKNIDGNNNNSKNNINNNNNNKNNNNNNNDNNNNNNDNNNNNNDNNNNDNNNNDNNNNDNNNNDNNNNNNNNNDNDDDDDSNVDDDVDNDNNSDDNLVDDLNGNENDNYNDNDNNNNNNYNYNDNSNENDNDNNYFGFGDINNEYETTYEKETTYDELAVNHSSPITSKLSGSIVLTNLPEIINTTVKTIMEKEEEERQKQNINSKNNENIIEEEEEEEKEKKNKKNSDDDEIDFINGPFPSFDETEEEDYEKLTRKERRKRRKKQLKLIKMREIHDYQLVVISSLSVLLIFLDGEEQIKLYKQSNIIDLLKKIERSDTLPRIKCLANLILSQLDVPIESSETGLIANEQSPLCRAAYLSRYQVTIRKFQESICDPRLPYNPTDEIKRDSYLFEVIAAMNDLYPLVRENALIVLSHAFDFPYEKEVHLKRLDKNYNNSKEILSEEDDEINPEALYIYKTLFDRIRLFLQNDDSIDESTAGLFVKNLRFLLYENSVRVNEIVIQFCLFLEAKLEHRKAEPLTSNLKFACLNKLSHLQNKDKMPKYFFKHETLVPPKFKSPVSASQPSSPSISMQSKQTTGTFSKKSKFQQPLCNKKSVQDDAAYESKMNINKKVQQTFTGKPAISPSGLLACSNIDGSFTYHVQSEESSMLKAKSVSVDWFSTSDTIRTTFQHFGNSRFNSNYNVSVNYLQFITDSKLLATSSSLQTVVIDVNLNEEPVCSFCGSKPSNYRSSIADYNNHNFSLLQGTEELNYVELFDFSTLKIIKQFQLQTKEPIYAIQWLKPYTSLFYVARKDIVFYDTRIGDKVFTIPNAGNTFIGGNVSYHSPMNFVMGNNCLNSKNNKQGVISMYTLGNAKVSSITVTKEFKEFEVHKHLPFAAAVTDSFFTFNFDNGDLIQQQQNLGYVPNSFAFHHSESLIAARIGNIVQCEKINY